MYLSCTSRLSSAEVFELLVPWYQWEPWQEIDSKHLYKIQAWDFGLCCLPCVDDDRIENGLLWRNVLVAWNCWDFALLCRLKNSREDPAIHGGLQWSSQSSLLRCVGWLDCHRESDFPSLAAVHWAPPGLGSLPARICQGSSLLAAHGHLPHGELLILGKIFLLCACSHNFLSFSLVQLLYSSPLVSILFP